MAEIIFLIYPSPASFILHLFQETPMATGSASKRTYPWTTDVEDQQVTLRLMERKDLENSVRFARELPEDDLMFLTIDITSPEAMEQYFRGVENDRAMTVLAEIDGRFVGYGSLTYNQLHWTRQL